MMQAAGWLEDPMKKRLAIWSLDLSLKVR